MQYQKSLIYAKDPLLARMMPPTLTTPHEEHIANTQLVKLNNSAGYPAGCWLYWLAMFRRTQTVYVQVDPFFSPRGKVLHRFQEFLDGLLESQTPCVWITSSTRAQVDEPRRRLGQTDPYIGEGGCAVFLPEDYFHLKSRDTIRRGRYTCIPMATPQPAAAEALTELSSDLGVPIVPLRSLTLRELSQNTGLPASEAERVRMRDFDELFFFAGASDGDVERFKREAKNRNLTLQNAGAFWSVSVGANVATCIKELGGLYDRALRSHALRVGVAVTASPDLPEMGELDRIVQTLSATCDRVYLLSERQPHEAPENEVTAVGHVEPDAISMPTQHSPRRPRIRANGMFHLQSPNVWENVLEALAEKR